MTPDGRLELGETWTYTYEYTITEADVLAGSVLNAVRVINPDDPDNPVEDEIVIPYDPSLIEVIATKVWDGGPSPRPTVWFQLWRSWVDGTTTYRESVPGAEIKELPDGITAVVWADILAKTIRGIPYTFYVKEVGATGNDFTPPHYVKTETGLVVTNCYQSPKIDVTVTKIWKGGSGVRPTIRIQLYRNGVAFGDPVELIHPNTTYTWKGLDRTDANGVEYRYTVDEVTVPVGYSKSVVGLTITNTYISEKPPEVPYTGDVNNAMLHGVLAIISLAGFGAVLVGKRRKKN